MKRISILCLIIALGLSVTGATCMQTVQTQACNPPANVIAVANAVISLLLPELNILLPGSAAFNAYVTAENISAGVCVGVTELNALIAYIQSSDAKALQNRAQVKAGPMLAKAFIDPQPLINWRDGVK